MPSELHRWYGFDHLHFITCSCFERRPLLGTPERRDLFLKVLEDVRRRYRFVVVGYVVMPEHFHLLLTEPEGDGLSTAMQATKLGFTRRVITQAAREHTRIESKTLWMPRFYDFNVWSARKINEKLRYMHRNPVTRGLVAAAEQWPWSSAGFYRLSRAGPVMLNAWPEAVPGAPMSRTPRDMGHPPKERG